MGFKDSFNRFFDISDDDMYEESQQAEEELGQTNQAVTGYFAKAEGSSTNKIVPLQQKPGTKATIKIYEPRIQSDMKEILDILLQNQAVVVNFAKCSDDVANKTINFVQGGIYAIGGRMERVGEKIFLCVPASVEIDGLDAMPD